MLKLCKTPHRPAVHTSNMLSLRTLASRTLLTGVIIAGLQLAGAAQKLEPGPAVQFPAGKTSVAIPFELLANVPYISVSVNDRGPFLFGVDTGAGSVALSSELQDAFGISLSGTGFGSGAGSGRFVTGIVAGKVKLTFAGGLVVTTEAARTSAMRGLWPLLARKIYGYIGYDVLRHFVVTFDYDKLLLTLSDPASPNLKTTGGLHFRQVSNNRSPQVDGELSVAAGAPPIAAPLNIDTGAGGIIISGPLVTANNLVQNTPTKLPSHSTGAGGGESRDWVARISDIRIGGYSVPHPIVALSQDREGSLTRSGFVNLGGNLLRRFLLTIDYPRALVFIQPNSHLNDPFPADASGMALKAEPDSFHSFTVVAVAPGSPAAEAGLEAGDVITELDGKSLDAVTQWDLLQLFTRAGERHRVGYTRAGKKLKSELRLRHLL